MFLKGQLISLFYYNLKEQVIKYFLRTKFCLLITSLFNNNVNNIYFTRKQCTNCTIKVKSRPAAFNYVKTQKYEQ